jgi:rhamnose transport system ATP-binding protein
MEELYELIEGLKAAGRAILFISHKFEESVPHRRPLHGVSRRAGWLVAARSATSSRRRAGPAMMVGRDDRKGCFRSARSRSARPVLEVDGLSHPTEFADISFARCAAARSSGSMR